MASALVFVLNEQRIIGHSLKQVHASLGLAIVGHGIHHRSKVIQSYKDTLYLSCNPRRSLQMCQRATRNVCMSLYLVELQEFIKRRLKSTGCQPTLMCRYQGETHSQLCDLVLYRLLLGHLPSHVLARLKLCNSGPYLIDEDRLPKLLDEPDDRLRALRLVENLCHLPFP
jgi:hypothetical protein